MTIHFLTYVNPYTSEGASANRWRSVVDGLVRQGAKTKLVITGGWSSSSEFQKYNSTGYIDSDKKIAYEYISRKKNFNLWSRRINMYFFDYISIPVLSLRFIKNLKKEKVDILFLQPYLNVFRLFSYVLKKLPDEMKVIMEINEYNDIAKEHATNYFQKKNVEKFNTLLFGRILPNLDALIVMTDKLKSHFSNIYSNNKQLPLYHMPMTVDLSRFAMVKSDDSYSSPYIAYCGTTSFKKDGIDILIKSFDKIADSFPDLSLYIAAYFENDGQKMLDLIQKSYFSERIIYLGTLPGEKVPAFISNATICALPRPDSRQAQGGFPTKLGEYLASGCPVCVTSVGEIPLYLKDKESAFFAEPGSVESFATVMKNVLLDRKLAYEVGLKGKLVAEKTFNKDIQGENLFKYLSNLINDAK